MRNIPNSLFICLLLCLACCAGTKKITYEQAKEVAKQDTTLVEVPVEVITPADSTSIHVDPAQLEPEQSIERTTDSGLSLKTTKRIDGTLDIKAKQAPQIIRDTVEVPVVTTIFNECEIDNHLDPADCEKKIEEEVARRLKEVSVKGVKERLIDMLVFMAWLVAGLLTFFLTIVLVQIYRAFS